MTKVYCVIDIKPCFDHCGKQAWLYSDNATFFVAAREEFLGAGNFFQLGTESLFKTARDPLFTVVSSLLWYVF